MKEFYQMTSKEVRETINGGNEPLTDDQISERQKEYGGNELIEGKKKSIPLIFLEQYKDFLVIILIISAIASAFMKDVESSIVILVVITMNAILGTVQTVKAEKSLESLKQLSAPKAKVLRNGKYTEIPGREVTVGDEVLIEAGDCIPADGRILTCASLSVDESALTGESQGVNKTQETYSEELPLGDRKNFMYSGCFATYGRATMIVTGTGMDTEVGKIALLLHNTSKKKTPLQVNLDKFGQKLSIAILILCAAIFVLNIIQGKPFADAFLFAVALAVAAIPEALSSIVTIVLSFGTQKMASEGAIIRKLQAVEGLGSVSVICSDKTGTLTQNKMTVEYYYVNDESVTADKININNKSHCQLLNASILCNDSTNYEGNEIGDPTETALINLGDKLGVPAHKVRGEYTRLSEVPFDSDRKLMSTLHHMEEGYVLVVKGAVDVIMKRLVGIQKNGKICEINEQDKRKIDDQNEHFSRQGLRVLAVAYKVYPEEKRVVMEDEFDLNFLGLIAMMDPPREESAAAVAECIEAGIRPVMITGDHKVTAAAIAKRIGILDNYSEACEGAEIDNMSDEELEDFVETIKVYARVSPEHKIRIVRAWQEKGNIVAMTGDGVNDAPALKQADIGVAMGITGSEVAKDAASMVLTDDNFATIVKAVENGRNVYANIKRSIQFLLSGNFAGILAVLYSALMALPVPFAPVHLLFINLLTDSLPAIALGLEPHTKDVMDEKPRPRDESILTKDFLQKVCIQGIVIAINTMIAFYIGLKVAGGNAVLASTMAFGTLCLSRLVHGYNCKADHPVIFTSAFWNNRWLQAAFAAGFVLLNAVLLIPGLKNVFSVQPLNWWQILTVYGLAILNLFTIQFIKFLLSKLPKHEKKADNTDEDNEIAE